MDCECGKPLTGRQTKYCSINCRNRASGRKHGGWNRNPIEKTCENCGASFVVPLHRAGTARACSKRCLGALQSRERKGTRLEHENPVWRGGIQTYRRHRKDACERCGSAGYLVVHHNNGDRYDNRLENLMTLCQRCHLDGHGHFDRRDERGRFTGDASGRPFGDQPQPS